MKKTAAAIFAVLVMCVAPALAGPVDFGVWYEFQFDGSLGFVTGCSPATCFDLAPGAQYASDPLWTFTAPPGGARLTVTDVNFHGDAFEIIANGLSLGFTSPPVDAGGCGPDPDLCLTEDLDVSSGVFMLAQGENSFTIRHTETQLGEGTGYFRVDVTPIPEPGAMALMASGLAALLWRRRAVK